MKGKKLSVLVLVGLLLVLMIAPGPAAARATKTECIGTEVKIAQPDPGIWTNPGGNYHVRGMVSQYREESPSCPEINGINTATMNANWSANFVGPMWGTSHSETDYGGGGVWEGVWHGALNADGTCTYKAVSHGISGSVAGLKLTLVADCTNPEITTFTATLLNPVGK